jgi:hypothetical protein
MYRIIIEILGGIAIIIKSYMKPHVKILKNTNVDYQRVKLENNLLIACEKNIK